MELSYLESGGVTGATIIILGLLYKILRNFKHCKSKCCSSEIDIDMKSQRSLESSPVTVSQPKPTVTVS